ncbi:3'-5' exonuclease [Confluentibacter flavum]|uniref:3'-5' exonuclease n=1 Tax=Confluentibacter flavum TaxID=1909700 RepID=A0A2N3HHZ2_9FLAO|nr:3'-5' exonuclease [Confluentibacter flavum]PKQ44587.1 3'-5' exonuclease [Confluentibacter flavum]
MNWTWFRKKYNDNHPDFWKAYVDSFDKKIKKPIHETRFVAFDTETTGFDKKEDRILSLGAVEIINKTIKANTTLEIYIKQAVFKPATVKIHGILKDGDLEKVSEIDAIKSFLTYINNDILIAHHAGFDYGMINEMLSRHGLGKLKNECIDTGALFSKSKHIIYHENLKKHYTLDDLCKELNVSMADRHTSIGDALITALVFLKTIARLDKRNVLKWDYLLK